jgi:pilus assembly protein Flp/PilA
LLLDPAGYVGVDLGKRRLFIPTVMTDQEELPMTMFKRFLKDESGATAIEYGLIASLIAVAIIAILTTLGTDLSTKFQAVSDGINGKK